MKEIAAEAEKVGLRVVLYPHANFYVDTVGDAVRVDIRRPRWAGQIASELHLLDETIIDGDAQICQGGGACATVCPTAAISYRHPGRPQLLESLSCLIATYREASNGGRPVLVLQDERCGVNLQPDWPGR